MTDRLVTVRPLLKRREPNVEGPRWWRARLEGDRLVVETGARWARRTASGMDLVEGRDETILALAIGQRLIVCGKTIAETSGFEVVDTLPAYLVKRLGDPVADGDVFVTPLRRKADR